MHLIVAFNDGTQKKVSSFDNKQICELLLRKDIADVYVDSNGKDSKPK